MMLDFDRFNDSGNAHFEFHFYQVISPPSLLFRAISQCKHARRTGDHIHPSSQSSAIASIQHLLFPRAMKANHQMYLIESFDPKVLYKKETLFG